jgi:phenylacetate-CoA ligase
MISHLYRRLPVPLQNAAVTMRNCRQLWRKFGYVRGGPSSPPPRPAGSPARWLNELLDTARNDCPYYADTLPKSMKVTEGTPIEEVLRSLPIVRKEVFREQAAYFISRKATRSNSQPFKTSGSTGTPIHGVISRRDLRDRYCAIWRWFERFGMSPAKRWARFLGADITTGADEGISRRDVIHNHLFLSVYHMSETTVGRYAETLRAYRPEILEGYPSAVATLARLMLACRQESPRIPAILVTAETLLPDQRDLIEKAFGARPLDYYGSSEFAPVLADGGDGFKHLLPETGLVELLDADDRPVRRGQIGRMVVTSFHSHFMPLIRYDIGDLARYVAGGPSSLVVSEIVGRMDDVIIGPDGRYVGRLSTALKTLPQTVQMAQCLVSPSRVRVLYVSPKAIPDREFVPFLRSLRDKVGDTSVVFEKVSDIRPGPRGKRPAVLREVPV